MPNIERVFFAIDVMNLFHSAKDYFGKDYRINFNKLVRMVTNKPICRLPRTLNSIAYTVTPNFRIKRDGTFQRTEVRKSIGFIKSLEHLSIQVKNRETYVEKGIAKPMATDWDVGITVDALNKLDEYDTFSLASGDGDYSLLIDDLKSKGKYTEIVTLEKSASRILCATAHRVMFITEKEMFLRSNDGRVPEKNQTSPYKDKAFPSQNRT